MRRTEPGRLASGRSIQRIRVEMEKNPVSSPWRKAFLKWRKKWTCYQAHPALPAAPDAQARVSEPGVGTHHAPRMRLSGRPGRAGGGRGPKPIMHQLEVAGADADAECSRWMTADSERGRISRTWGGHPLHVKGARDRLQTYDSSHNLCYGSIRVKGAHGRSQSHNRSLFRIDANRCVFRIPRIQAQGQRGRLRTAVATPIFDHNHARSAPAGLWLRAWGLWEPGTRHRTQICCRASA